MRDIQPTSLTDTELLNYCEIHWDEVGPEFLKELVRRMVRYLETHTPNNTEEKDERQLPLF
jgi:hypothetical protein